MFSSPGDFYDFNFVANFNGVDTARPFFGNRNAPANSVGVFGADACAFLGSATACAAPPNQLIDYTALNATGQIVPVTNNDVRYIVNGGGSQAIFGTPFGNVPRNIAQDEMTSIGNVSVFKNIKFNERVAFEFHVTAINVLNTPNYLSVDPFLEDAGNGANPQTVGPFNGFGDVTVTNSQPRRLLFGGRISF